MLTDNPVLVNNIRPEQTIMCAQRNAAKVIVTEEMLIQANIDSFGDDIGKITNRITTMFDVLAQFEPGSDEYEALNYRIKCGQLFQQNAIDKAKGIIAKPMPKEWYDRSANRITEDMSEEEKAKGQFNIRILADKKPYFMRYIYPNLMTQYNTYIKNTDKKCVREFRKTVDELLSNDPDSLSNEERTFLNYYHQRMPVGMHDCVMNKICRRFEEEFDGYFLKNINEDAFDYRVMKSSQEYTSKQYADIGRLYVQYTKRLQEYMQFAKRERIDEDEASSTRGMMVSEFKKDCYGVCSNAHQLCDIILDLCYSKSGTKQLCWDVCSEEIIDNLLEKNSNRITYPLQDDAGSVLFCGKRFSFVSKECVR